MNQVVREIVNGNDQQFPPVAKKDYNNFLVISLGTGSNRTEQKFSAEKAAKWGIFGWLNQNGNSPIVNIFNFGSAEMVDIHLAVLFEALRPRSDTSKEMTYLCIQDEALTGSAVSMDDASIQNMDKLIQIGNGLLDKHVSSINLETGLFEEISGAGTNREMLTKIAGMLSEERKARAASS